MEVSDSELSELVSSVAASKEAMNVLGSALADQVVCALKAQDLVHAQQPGPGSQPAMRSNDMALMRLFGFSNQHVTICHCFSSSRQSVCLAS